MEMSHVADDFAAIARRLKELREEQEIAEQRAAMPARRPNLTDTSFRPFRAEPGALRLHAS